MYAILISAITGFIFILGLLYACQNSIANALNGVSEHAVINIFNISLKDKASGETNLAFCLALTVILVLNIFLAGFSHMTVTTRVVYALSRDQALPYS